MSHRLTTPAEASIWGHVRAMLALGLPLIGSHLAQMALHVTATVIMGWYGVAELAAVVLGGSAFFVIFILGSGFAQAVMPMVAQAMGRGDEAQVRRDARMGLWLSILYGVLTYPLFWFSGAILLALGQKPEVAALAQDFLRLAGLGMVAALAVMVLKSYLAALERTQVVLWVTVAVVPLNAVLCWALAFGHGPWPAMGVAGAALASLAMQLLSVLALAGYAAWLPMARKFRLFQRFWRPDWHAMGQVFRLGLPIGLTALAESGLFQAVALMMGWIGTVELAAHGIAMQITAVGFMVHVGLSNAVTVRVGRFAGAGEWAAARRTGKVAVGLSALVACGQVVIYLTLAAPIVSLFLDRGNPQAPALIGFGAMLLAYAAAFQIMDAGQVLALGLLRGVQDTRVPMWIAIGAYWLAGAPAAYLLAFPLGLGGPGLWLGLTLGLTLASSLLMWRFWSRVPRG